MDQDSLSQYVRQMKKYQIINDDRMKLLKKFKSNSVQLIITSPPYNIGKSYEKKTTLKEYLNEQRRTLVECRRILKNEGSEKGILSNGLDHFLVELEEKRQVPLNHPLARCIQRLPKNGYRSLSRSERVKWLRTAISALGVGKTVTPKRNEKKS